MDLEGCEFLEVGAKRSNPYKSVGNRGSSTIGSAKNLRGAELQCCFAATIPCSEALKGHRGAAGMLHLEKQSRAEAYCNNNPRLQTA